jgi:hypothetical protein
VPKQPKNRDPKQHPTQQDANDANLLPPAKDHSQSAGSHNYGKYHKHPPETHKRFWKDWSTLERIQAVFDLCVMMFTGGLLLTSYYQWSTMDRQLIQMKAQTHAYVGVAGGDFKTGRLRILADGSATTDQCYVRAKNFGTYPAQTVIGFCELIITQNLAPVQKRARDECHAPTPETYGSVLVPGTDDSTWDWPTQTSIKDYIRNPGSGDDFIAIMLVGVQYRDQFRAPHCTVYMYRLQPPGSINAMPFKDIPGTEVDGVWNKTEGMIDPP